MNHIKVCLTMQTLVLGTTKKKEWWGEKKTKANKWLCMVTCTHGYRAWRPPDHCHRSMLSVNIKGPTSQISLNQQSGPVSKMLHVHRVKKVLLFHFVLSFCITLSFFSCRSAASSPTFEDQYWEVQRWGEASVSGPALHDRWLDKEVDRSCPISLLFTLADEKPRKVLRRWDACETICCVYPPPKKKPDRGRGG